jgi:hypothetical protein
MTAGKALHRSLALIAVVATALLLAGCPSAPRVGTSTVDRAVAASRAGDHAGAAALYERLAGETTGATAWNSACARPVPGWPGRAADADRLLANIGPGATTAGARAETAAHPVSGGAGPGDQAWREISAMQAPAAPAAAL